MDAVSEKINRLRKEARGNSGLRELDQCPSCTRDKYSPFRQYDKHGKVLLGCIDPYHSGHLSTLSESSRWHNSKMAQAWRRAELKQLETLTKDLRRLEKQK